MEDGDAQTRVLVEQVVADDQRLPAPTPLVMVSVARSSG
jgi:hypothetical protein